jgi:hypothetical protein
MPVPPKNGGSAPAEPGLTHPTGMRPGRPRSQGGLRWLLAALSACLLASCRSPKPDPAQESAVGLSAASTASSSPGPELEAKPLTDRGPGGAAGGGRPAARLGVPVRPRILRPRPRQPTTCGTPPPQGRPPVGDLPPLPVAVVPVRPPGQVEPKPLAIAPGPPDRRLPAPGGRRGRPLGPRPGRPGGVVLLPPQAGRRGGGRTTRVAGRPAPAAGRGGGGREAVAAELAGLERGPARPLAAAAPAGSRRPGRGDGCDAGPPRGRAPAGELEAWLHKPGTAAPVDVGALLRPYHELPPDALEASGGREPPDAAGVSDRWQDQGLTPPARRGGVPMTPVRNPFAVPLVWPSSFAYELVLLALWCRPPCWPGRGPTGGCSRPAGWCCRSTGSAAAPGGGPGPSSPWPRACRRCSWPSAS